MNNNTLNLFLFLFLYNIPQLQDTKSIHLSGNIKTSSSSIINTINYQIYNQNTKNIINDIRKLKELEVFDSISINIQDSIYLVNVIEKKTFSYFPVIKKMDGLGWSYGTNLHINNIRGSLGNADLLFTIGKIKSTRIKYNKKKIELIYIYNQKESIDGDYLNNEYSIQSNYYINNKVYVTFGIFNNKLKYYRTNDLSLFHFLRTSLAYKNSIKNNFIKARLDINHALINNNHSYKKLSIEYLKNIKIINNSIQSNVIFKTYLILNTHPGNDSIDYENLYLGGDNFVRGFNPNPLNNATAAINKLKFNSMLFQSIQFEVPFTSNQYIQSKILLFNDFSIGSNNYKHFTSNNKIKGYGMGIAIIMQNNMRVDFCIGLNKYGTAELHFFKNVNF